MSDADTDDRQDQETLIICELKESMSIDELHTAKAALTGAGFILEEDLSDGQLVIRRAGPNDTIALPDEYRDQVTEEIENQIDEAMERFKRKLDRLVDQSSDQDGTVQLSEEYEDLDSNEIIDKVRDEHSIGSETEDSTDEPSQEDTDTAPAESSEEDGLTEDQDTEQETAESDEGEESDEDEFGTTYTCSNCGQEFDAPFKTQPEYHDCPGGETDEDGATGTWTSENVLTVMEGNGWMTTNEIAEAVTGESDPSYATREKFHKRRHDNPELADQLESRRDPDDGRRKQYRLKSDDAADDTEEGGDVHPDYVADCPDCDYREEFQDTDAADNALEVHIAEEHSDGEDDAEAGSGKNRPGTRQPEAVNPA